MLISGTIRTFGILYAELLDTFNEGAGNTAFVGSLTFFIMAITGDITYLIRRSHTTYLYGNFVSI